jgi:ElaB/YqjD/DUF883 family membrane-anchored ribosome-binding protein
MNKSTQDSSSDMGTIADDARDLLAATADVGGEKVSEVRKRLTAALERGKQLAGQARDKTVAAAKAADEAVHEHPYQAMAIAFGVGALVGFLAARRYSSKLGFWLLGKTGSNCCRWKCRRGESVSCAPSFWHSARRF